MFRSQSWNTSRVKYYEQGDLDLNALLYYEIFYC